MIEPLDHRRAGRARTGAKAVFPTADEFVSGPGKGGRPLVIEGTNNPFGFRDAVRARGSAAELFLRAFRTATPTCFRGDARRRGLKIKFVRRMGDDYPRAIDLVRSGRVNVRAIVTHRESLGAASVLFKALAQNQPSYVKALLYRNGKEGDGPN